MTIISLLIKAFYPPTLITFSPLVAIIKSTVEGVVQLIVLGLFIAFTYPVRTEVERFQLSLVRSVALYTTIGYVVFSLLPYAFKVPYVQTYIGLIIAFNVLNGGFAGTLASLSKR